MLGQRQDGRRRSDLLPEGLEWSKARQLDVGWAVLQHGPGCARGVARDAEADIRQGASRLDDLRDGLVRTVGRDHKDKPLVVNHPVPLRGRVGVGGGELRRRVGDDHGARGPGSDELLVHRVGHDHGRRPAAKRPLQRQAPAPLASFEGSGVAVHDVLPSRLRGVDGDGRHGENRGVHHEDDLGSMPVEAAQRLHELRAVFERRRDQVALAQIAAVDGGEPKRIDESLAAAA